MWLGGVPIPSETGFVAHSDGDVAIHALCDALLGERGYRVGNVDITIALQRPKLAPHILSMRETLARVMGIPVDAVSVKATTTERLGFVGRCEGCEVWASATVIKP